MAWGDYQYFKKKKRKKKKQLLLPFSIWNSRNYFWSLLDQHYFSSRITLNFTDIPEKCLIK